MSMFGIPAPVEPPEFSLDDFKLYIPKLAWYPEKNETTMKLYNKAVEKMRQKLNYSYWLEEWDEAMALAVAHFILITDPAFTQSTDGDTTAGGVMKSRNVANVSYDYDIDYYMSKNTGYGYFNTTGYGRRLIELSNSRGWLGIFTS